MTILFAASELAGRAGAGPLAEALQALPAALAARGHEVSVVLPCYRGLAADPAHPVKSTGVKFTVPVGDRHVPVEILEGQAAPGVQLFLVRGDEYFDRAGRYGENGREYEDNAARFIFFSRAVVELARRILPPPEILHVHDWQTALVPVFNRERRYPFRTVLTVHGLAGQGSFWAYDFGLTRLPGHYFSAPGVEFFGRLNFLKGGLLYADAITTVSERYAREIQTPERGAGLDSVLREQSHKLTGILQGADYAVWNPATDGLLPARYTPDDLAGKRACREALLRKLKLDPEPKGPVYTMEITRAGHRGLDLLLPILDRLLADDLRLVIHGESEGRHERELMIAARRHPRRLALLRHAPPALAHLIEAGADLALIPAFAEPRGLAAMQALKYGTLPVARAAGGVHEIIQDEDAGAEHGTGFLFFHPHPEGLWDALVRAGKLFRQPALWAKLQRRAMMEDFSWDRAVLRYETLYGNLLKRR